MSRSSFVRQPLERVVARYDRVAPWYRFGEWTILLAPGFRRRAITRLGLKPGQRAVEVGCGTGRNLRLLREAVGGEGEVIGVDASAGMLAEAQKTISRRGWRNVTLIHEDAAKLALDEPVDVAYFSLSYSVMPDRDPALDAAWNAVRRGGRVAIMDAGMPDSRVVGDLLALRSIADLDGLSFDHDIETVESVLARGENALWVLLEVLCLTLFRTRAEVHCVGVPHGQQRGDVRATIRAHRREPKHLRLVDVPASLRPICWGGLRAAEPGVELSNRHLCRHVISFR
jgi:ubiquinone/menaquinone biosynthesis C-methylase UbiE